METNIDERTLCCGNLAPKVNEEILYELFVQAGPIEYVHIHRIKQPASMFAFVVFKQSVSVLYSIALMEGIALYGVELKLYPKTQASTIENNPYEKMLAAYFETKRSQPMFQDSHSFPEQHPIQRNSPHMLNVPLGLNAQFERNFPDHSNFPPQYFQQQNPYQWPDPGDQFQMPMNRVLVDGPQDPYFPHSSPQPSFIHQGLNEVDFHFDGMQQPHPSSLMFQNPMMFQSQLNNYPYPGVIHPIGDRFISAASSPVFYRRRKRKRKRRARDSRKCIVR